MVGSHPNLSILAVRCMISQHLILQSSQEDYILIDVHVGGQDRTFNLPCDYELWSYVGRGSFGCVYHYKDADSNLDLAMKCIPTQDCG